MAGCGVAELNLKVLIHDISSRMNGYEVSLCNFCSKTLLYTIRSVEMIPTIYRKDKFGR
jgi:hypothetical protein